MGTKLIRKFLRKVLSIYLIYIALFAFVLFAIKKPNKREFLENHQNDSNNLKSNSNDRIALAELGKEGALARLNLIENAQNTIDIACYSIHEGKTTDILFGCILSSAGRGVKVRIILDGLAVNINKELKQSIKGLELHPNIEIKLYNKLHPLSPWRWNNRLHDKITIVDGKLGLIGGRNIGDKYFAKEFTKRSFSKDRDVVIFKDNGSANTHSVINDMENYYKKLWNYKYSESAAKKLSNKKNKIANDTNKQYLNIYLEYSKEFPEKLSTVDWRKVTIPVDDIKFVHNPLGIGNNDAWCLRELLRLSEKTQKNIFVQSPYIVPTKRMMRKFNQYDIDLKKMSLLTNSLYSGTNPLAISGYFNVRKKIVDSGVTLYEYQGMDSIHAKTYIYDDSISVIGSFNMDSRSSYLNTESMVIVYGKDFADVLKQKIQIDLDKSLKVGKDYSHINNNIEAGIVSAPIKIITNLLSKLSWFWSFLL